MTELTIEAAKTYVAAKHDEWGLGCLFIDAYVCGAGEVVQLVVADGNSRLTWDVWVEGGALYGEC